MKQRWTSNLFMLSYLLLLVFLRASKFKLFFRYILLYFHLCYRLLTEVGLTNKLSS